MKNLRFSVVLMGLVASVAYAGGERDGTGNGGSGWVCRNSKGAVLSVTVSDLFEATGYGLTVNYALVARNDESPALGKVKNHSLYSALVAARKEVQSRVFLDPGPLPAVDDVHSTILPQSRAKGCRQEQIAIYGPDPLQRSNLDVLRIDQEIDAFMRSQDGMDEGDLIEREALFDHEAVYLMDRQLTGATDSIRAREIVANLYAVRPDRARLKFLLDQIAERKPADSSLGKKVDWNEVVDQNATYLENGTHSQCGLQVTGFNAMTGDMEIAFSARSTQARCYPSANVLAEFRCKADPTFPSRLQCSSRTTLDASAPHDRVDLFFSQNGRVSRRICRTYRGDLPGTQCYGSVYKKAN